VDYQIAMCVGNGIQNAEEEMAASLGIEPVFAAEHVEGPAFHIFHDEERTPVGSRSSVEEPRDVGVVQIGEDLAFVPETPENVLGVHSVPDYLNRHVFLKLVVVAYGLVNGAHSASADFVHHSPGAEPVPGKTSCLDAQKGFLIGYGC